MDCPSCGGKRRKETAVIGVFECQKCGAVFGRCYLGESYEVVKPFFATENVLPEKTRYYDLECLGSKGIERRHGWFDPVTGLEGVMALIEIPVAVRHTNLTDEEEEARYDFDDEESWERSLPKQLVPREKLVDFLEQCSHKTERVEWPRERLNLILSFEYWPEFVLVQIYDGYIE